NGVESDVGFLTTDSTRGCQYRRRKTSLLFYRSGLPPASIQTSKNRAAQKFLLFQKKIPSGSPFGELRGFSKQGRWYISLVPASAERPIQLHERLKPRSLQIGQFESRLQCSSLCIDDVP